MRVGSDTYHTISSDGNVSHLTHLKYEIHPTSDIAFKLRQVRFHYLYCLALARLPIRVFLILVSQFLLELERHKATKVSPFLNKI